METSHECRNGGLGEELDWELVYLPAGNRLVGCKWGCTLKYKANGSLEGYKVRLVAKGYTKIYGVNYLETFASIAKMNMVRILLSLTTNYNWDLQQFGIKNAFFSWRFGRRNLYGSSS